MRPDPAWLRTVRLALPLSALALAACQTTPGPGAAVRAQVVAVPLTRAALERGANYGQLHPALRAGATAADAGAGRVLLAGCAVPDAASASGARLYTVSTVLPAGVAFVPGALLQLQVDDPPFDRAPIDGSSPVVHGRFVAMASAALDERNGVAWRLRPGDVPKLQARCRPEGAAPGRVQATAFRPVRDDEMGFAAAEAARHAAFSDAEIAAGAVVRVRCQLRMADGAEWHTPEFLARAPAGLDLRRGDVVRLRAGVDEGSRASGPVGEIVLREGTAPMPGGRTEVGCRS